MVVDFEKNLCGIHKPHEGWEEKTWYEVLVKFSKYNCPFYALLYTGFIDNKTGRPGSYHKIVSATCNNEKINNLYYLKVKSKLCTH